MQAKQSELEKDKKHILFVGGHGGTAAISVIEKIKKNKKPWDLYWTGPARAGEASKVATLEEKAFRTYGITFYPIIAGKLQKKFTVHTITSLLKIPVGFVHGLVILNKARPTLVFSVGGFAAIPVVFWAFVLGIPVFIHDQTAIGLGLANRLSAPFAKKILVARATKQIEDKFGAKLLVVGNPVRESIFRVGAKAKIGSPVTVFVFTGSRGSQIINQRIDRILERMLNTFKVIHLTGDLDFKYFTNRKKELPHNLSINYEVHNFINPDEVYKYYQASDIIIARAGANTVSEIQIVKRPAILIPLPILNYSEQEVNAKLAADTGGAVVLDQDSTDENDLYNSIMEVVAKWDKMVASMRRKESPDSQAADKIFNLIDLEISGSV